MGFATNPVKQSSAGEVQGMNLRAGRQITSSLPDSDAERYHAEGLRANSIIPSCGLSNNFHQQRF